MHTSTYIYHHADQAFHGYLAYDDSNPDPRPAVLVVHDWSGCGTLAHQTAEKLVTWGYLAFAVDMFGLGRIGETTEEKQALIMPLLNDRRLLRKRMNAALDTVITMDEVDNDRIGAMGFCFGGLCALDLARSGADIAGVVSFHGLLDAPTDVGVHPIKARVLALHGYDDPMVRPKDVNLFCDEMTAANVDWQVHMYGQTQHAFTNPNAHDTHLGTVYNPVAAHRAFQAAQNFLADTLK